jgi:DNA polymerase-3 subunit delta'
MAKRKAAETGAAEGQEAGGPSPCHPRFTEKLFGHVAAEEMFLSAFNAGSLHHAWLLTGERGIGKATFAYRAARFLLSRDHDAAAEPRNSLDAPASHPAARQIAAGAHPSLFVLDKETRVWLDPDTKESFGVKAVRKLRAFLSMTSPGGWRAMIVDPANDLTISSANALLKGIEEPPPRTVFFLVSHGAAAVIPTIRSRCIKLAFRPLGFPDFQSAVSAAAAAGGLDEPEAEDMSRIFALSAGSPGRALDLLSGGFLSLAGKVERLIEGLPRLDQGLVHELIQSSGGKGNAETFTRLCDFIEERVADRAKKEALQNAGPAAGAASWAELWQTARARRLEMEALNLDKGAFLITVFSDMERIARKH